MSNNLFNEILNFANELNVKGSNNNSNNREIYKKELFSGMNEIEEKKARKKLRKLALNWFELIINSKDTKKDIANFKNYFSQVYNVEFSENAFDNFKKESSKDLVKKAFYIINSNDSTNKNKSNKK